MKADTFRMFARMGVAIRLKELAEQQEVIDTERRMIHKLFPTLALKASAPIPAPVVPEPKPINNHTRKPHSAAAKKRISRGIRRALRAKRKAAAEAAAKGAKK